MHKTIEVISAANQFTDPPKNYIFNNGRKLSREKRSESNIQSILQSITSTNQLFEKDTFQNLSKSMFGFKIPASEVLLYSPMM